MMKGLPLDIIDEILFKLERKSLAMMGCTNKYFKSHIFEDPYFEINYFSRVRSRFVLRYKGDIGTISLSTGKSTDVLLGKNCYILHSCSGLLLLFIPSLLFVVNPLTKRFRLIDTSWSELRRVTQACNLKGVGFLAERNRTIHRFKIVFVFEKFDIYEFIISDGDSWRLSKTTIISDSKSGFLWSNSVYLDGTFHWLRYDGSIITFNPETEQASFQAFLISSSSKSGISRFLAVDEKINRLTLILGTRETISIYTLKNSKWTLARQIKNIPMEEYQDVDWEIVAYDGMQLVVEEEKKLNGDLVTKVHVYDMEANSWRVLGSSGRWYYTKFTPSWFSMKNEHDFKELLVSDDKRMSDLADVIEYINTHSCGS